MSESRSKILIVFLSLVTIWSSTWIFMKISVGDTPFFAAAIRFFIASGVLTIYQKWRKRSISIQREHLRVYLTVGLGNFFLGYGLTYWAIPYVYSNVASLLWATFPVLVAIAAQISLPNERINLRRVLSLVLAVSGSILIFDVRSLDMGPRAPEGMTLILLSVAAAAFSNVQVKKFGHELDVVRMNLNGMFMGAILLLSVALFKEPWQTFPLTFPVLGATAYLAILGSAITFTLYFWLLKHIPVTTASYITFLVPIFASIIGWVFLDEVLGPKTLLGGALILSGVLLPDLWRRVTARLS